MIKEFHRQDYNYIFDTQTGFFVRWGKDFDDDPICCEYGVEIADIEIASGKCSGGCSYCYKSNSSKKNNTYMPLSLFKRVFNIIKTDVLTQVALGITDIDTNPELESILDYIREEGVVPNITINGKKMNSYFYDMLAQKCGAIAVSYHDDIDICLNAVSELTKRGKQVNIHYVLAKETFDLDLIDKIYLDDRAQGLNALVFLTLKKKGKLNTYSNINFEDLEKLIRHCLSKKIGFGFDSCAGNFVRDILINNPKTTNFVQFIEPCESSLFSIYVNTEGIAYPCSFVEGDMCGVDLKQITSFKDVWFSEQFLEFRKKILNNKRNCIFYKVIEKNA